MNNLLSQFLDGDILTDREYVELLAKLHQIEKALSVPGLGDFFHFSKSATRLEMFRLRNICESRGINSDPDKKTCPHCFKALVVPLVQVQDDICTFEQNPTIITECCNKPIQLVISRQYTVTKG